MPSNPITLHATEPDTDSIESAIGNSELNNLPRHFPTNTAHGQAGGGGGGGNLVNHGGPTITSAHVVAIYWGSSWSGSSLATSLSNYLSAYGTTGEYNTITQYSGIQKSNLGNTGWVDTSNPPTNATPRPRPWRRAAPGGTRWMPNCTRCPMTPTAPTAPKRRSPA